MFDIRVEPWALLRLLYIMEFLLQQSFELFEVKLGRRRKIPDITMCMGTGCAVKEFCHRYTAKSTPLRQSYFAVSPGEDEKCEYFWSNGKKTVDTDVSNQ